MKSRFRLYAREQELKVRFEPSGQETTVMAGDYLDISVWPLRADQADDAELTLDYWEDEMVISQDWCLLYAEDSTGMDVGV
ncbi:hypothetical protein [Nocardia mangyaensis]|uniref:hypothetical protein n=1 Tax=Nocardia mangyaensis TaxID=2213200 RepID=UPI00267708FC|nr:hypothetical protein [Nocardia mangyaensis]MDO3649338.1 hypothetical protein [Nocardia mangyaensis]